MFSFFTKKRFLIDHLEGFVDIHNHILPGIDDGAKSVEGSLELIKGFSEFGVTDFICTPHIMENYYPNTPETINNSMALLQNALKMNDLKHVHIQAAAEHMIDAGFAEKLEKKNIMPLADNYLLIEMSFLQPPLNLYDSVDYILKKQYFPILAHPERYSFLHKKFESYKAYKDRGMLMQLNLLSLSKYYGEDVQKAGYKLLEGGLIDFLATDVHNENQLIAIKSIIIPKKMEKIIYAARDRTVYNFSLS